MKTMTVTITVKIARPHSARERLHLATVCNYVADHARELFHDYDECNIKSQPLHGYDFAKAGTITFEEAEEYTQEAIDASQKGKV